MIPTNLTGPPTQSSAPGWQWTFAGCNGPDVPRPAYAMVAGPDIRGYFDGPAHVESSTQLHGQPTMEYR